ncbi:hypothetical protein B5F77_01100 [Parabacteroides sp. An277]|uniref:PCMD domain-containing protein n=1 Tax=Parabacteroides sp. An277 TaxID=1965619 RepID=UPI000B39AD5A|nr:PCMD domain-containing protein [Parabacteroides sp. An277]OUO55482.1 hypothetical protein B5F77_01100 [Parabacteroides sp. An277]
MKICSEILVLFVLVFLFSCQVNDEISLRDVGYIRLSVIENTEGNTRSSETRATYDPTILGVEIIDSNNKVVKETDDWTEWEGEAISLPAGRYIVAAQSQNYDGASGFDLPCYYGADTVDVVAGKDSEAAVVCKVTNVKVTVNFDEELKQAFADRNVSVRVRSANSEVTPKPITFKVNETRSGYFPADCGDLMATLTVSNADTTYTLDEVDDLKAPKSNDHFILNYKLSEESNGEFTVTVDPTTNSYSYTFYVCMEPVDVSAYVEPANAWATFADLEASNITSNVIEIDPEAIKFLYRVKDAADWTEVKTTYDNGTYTARPTGLTPGTTYEYCLYINETTNTPAQTFTTEEATALYNGGFDNWSYGTGDYDKTWFAEEASKAGLGTSFWDSGNIGTSTYLTSLVGVHNPTSPEEIDVHTSNGKAAKLASQFVGFMGAGKFAAGNIYTGNYCETFASPMGARIRFGQEFTSRPTQLKGWYKYSRGTNIDEDNDATLANTLKDAGGDLCSVYIALVDNEGLAADGSYPAAAFEIDNRLSADQPESFKYKNTIDFSENNPHIIAYGELSEDEAKGTGQWQEFTIDLEYRDLTRKPKYIIVVASASKYGDFFTGSTSSVMYIDDFELVYDGEPKTEE